MSSARGAGPTRQRPQKHKNTFAFKNNLHDRTPQMQRINALHVSEVCQRCKLQIEWKIKYKKYKPLTQAKTCIRCQQRTVKKAYHVACKDCARKERCCAKCLQSAEQVEIVPAEPTAREEQQIQVEMDRLIKSLPERKRRTFLRFMKRGKESEDAADEDADAANGAGAGAAGGRQPSQTSDEATATEDESGAAAAAPLRRKRVPHSRADLLSKIEALRIAEENELGESDDEDEENTDSDEYDCEYSDDLESDEDDDAEEEDEEEEEVAAPKKSSAKK